MPKLDKLINSIEKDVKKMDSHTEFKKKIDKYKQNKERIDECNNILNSYLENLDNTNSESDTKESEENEKINFDEIYKNLENNKFKMENQELGIEDIYNLFQESKIFIQKLDNYLVNKKQEIINLE